jgi:hypothetical protein
LCLSEFDFFLHLRPWEQIVGVVKFLSSLVGGSMIAFQSHKRISNLLLIALTSLVGFALLTSRSAAQNCAPPNCWTGNFYQYEIVAQTGETVDVGTLTGFGIYPSINENGTVAFVGQVSSGSGQLLGDTLFFGAAGSSAVTTVAPNFLSTSRSFDDAVQINDNNQIAAVDEFSGSPPNFYLRIWDGNNPGSETDVATATGPTSGRKLQAVLTEATVNIANGVAFSALDHDFKPILIATSPPYSQMNQTQANAPLRPMIADDGSAVFRAGNTNTSPIVLTLNYLKSSIVIANSGEFSALGESPGISRDGVVVVFAGDLKSAGKWDNDPGPGIFAAIVANGKVQYRLRVAGFGVKKRIQTQSVAKIKIRLEGAPWCDPGTKGCLLGGELEDLPPFGVPTYAYFQTFTEDGFQNSTEWENRIAVTHADFGGTGIDGDTVIVSFIATPNQDDSKGLGLFSANQGIWTVRGDLFLDNGKLFAHVYRPVPVIQVGDPLGTTGQSVTALSVFDQLANMTPEQANGDHRLGFWVCTQAGGCSNGSQSQVILRASYIQQYGSSGWFAQSPSTCCFAGTLGALTNIAGTNYILSNDHVLGDPQSLTQNGAQVGDPISQPGPFDYACRDPHTVATFFAAPTLSTGVDAALGELGNSEINATGQIYNIGVPASTLGNPAVGMHVAKQGDSSGLTCATIIAVHCVIPSVPYNQSCNGANFKAPFKNQIEIESDNPNYPFDLHGDSGSLIVDYKTAQPIGLLFAGGVDLKKKNIAVTLANPISDVLGELNKVVGQQVSLVGGTQHVVAGCHFKAPEVILSEAETERVDLVKTRYEAQLFQDPAVLGMCLGAADDDPAEGVFVIKVDAGSEHRPIPPVLDGVRTKIVFDEQPRALGAQSCPR